MSPEATALLAEITNQGHAFNSESPGARRKLLDAAVSLVAELETPIETITRIAWAEPVLYTSLRIAIDLKLFTSLVEPDKSPKSVAKLAEATNSDPQLLARILKHLGAMKIILEPEAGVFSTTPLAEALIIPEYRDTISAVFDSTQPCLTKLPAYLAETKYRNPADPEICPFQYAFGTKQAFFDYLASHPELSASFNNYMAGHRRGRPSWMDADFYPVQDALKGVELRDDTPLLVDVGGSIGHDVIEFKSKCPALPGRLIVQDLPGTIPKTPLNDQGIEFMAYDFFTPQPIRVMKKGYSKLLIHENVVPNQHAPWSTTALDIQLMALAASSERPETHWRDLLTAAGLKIIKIWSHPEGTESLIETEMV
ncbi:MAG: hypothetical protein Q9169_004154 [Polycauliona sp. 2 TL-2023]